MAEGELALFGDPLLMEGGLPLEVGGLTLEDGGGAGGSFGVLDTGGLSIASSYLKGWWHDRIRGIGESEH